MRRFALLCLASAAAALQGFANPEPVARPPAEQRTIPWTGQMPHCDDPAVVTKVASHFGQREREYWRSGLEMIGIDRPHAVALRPWGRDIIPRRYCSGRALFNDNRHRTIYYSVIEDGGIIGMTWGVEWCVLGLDRHRSFAPWCKMALP